MKQLGVASLDLDGVKAVNKCTAKVRVNGFNGNGRFVSPRQLGLDRTGKHVLDTSIPAPRFDLPPN